MGSNKISDCRSLCGEEAQKQKSRCGIPPQRVRFGNMEQQREHALTFERSWSKRYKACSGMAKNRNFDRNRVRGCNFGSEGGAVLIFRGCIIFITYFSSQSETCFSALSRSFCAVVPAMASPSRTVAPEQAV